MPEPLPVTRMARVTLLLAETALSTGDGNGGGHVHPDVAYTLSRVALAAPATAARCRRVRAVLDPATLAVVLASVQPATRPAEPAPDAPESPLSTAQVAATLGISPQAVRAAAGRGTLAGAKHPHTGEWRFAPAAVREYAHGKGR